jgi:hypothetical protein
MSSRRWLSALVAGALAAVGLTAVAVPPVGALNIITVTTTADGGPGSLRQAFADASTDGDDTRIELQPGALYELTCAGGGQLEHTEDNQLIIFGNGATVDQTCADERVIENDATNLIVVTEMTITGGNTNADGGAIRADGSVRAQRVYFTGNEQGTIDAEADVLIIQSTITNSTHGDGFIVHSSFGSVHIINSTLFGNSTPANALVAGDEGVFVVYSTLTGNSGESTLRAPNANPDSANVIELFASVVMAPTGGGPACDIDSGDPVTSFGYNFSNDTSCNLTNTGDSQNAANNPQVGPLANNGGATPTLLPATTSPLVDKIPVASCQDDGATGITLDQRDLPRPAGNGCDIGSVELQPATPPAPPVPLSPNFTG